jgi:hypothetical protein
LTGLFAYPCIDFVVTLIRRYKAESSIFLPDKDHLHNRIYYHFQWWLPSKALANSMTGVLVVASSSRIALAGYLDQWWLVTSDLWSWVILLQCVDYSVVFYLTGLSRSNSQYTVLHKSSTILSRIPRALLLHWATTSWHKGLRLELISSYKTRAL